MCMFNRNVSKHGQTLDKQGSRADSCTNLGLVSGPVSPYIASKSSMLTPLWGAISMKTAAKKSSQNI